VAIKLADVAFDIGSAGAGAVETYKFDLFPC